ncbi:zinc finger protein 496-like [Ornithorhynchus anatinus]|uniref:zinc finger protein 496-like n=1 Tax=Ornithorhynchus anatinus TaxID=9258 RepID=UPI0019D4926C|nr:zinc finger protein 496-like [Ornithorhynchus anatinus]
MHGSSRNQRRSLLELPPPPGPARPVLDVQVPTPGGCGGRLGRGAGARAALVRLRELCRRWLRPERRSKERMLELVVLDRLVGALPRRARAWVRRRRPRTAEDVVLALDALDALEAPEAPEAPDARPGPLHWVRTRWGSLPTGSPAPHPAPPGDGHGARPHPAPWRRAAPEPADLPPAPPGGGLLWGNGGGTHPQPAPWGWAALGQRRRDPPGSRPLASGARARGERLTDTVVVVSAIATETPARGTVRSPPSSARRVLGGNGRAPGPAVRAESAPDRGPNERGDGLWAGEGAAASPAPPPSGRVTPGASPRLSGPRSPPPENGGGDGEPPEGPPEDPVSRPARRRRPADTGGGAAPRPGGGRPTGAARPLRDGSPPGGVGPRVISISSGEEDVIWVPAARAPPAAPGPAGPPAGKPYRCPDCGRWFRWRANFLRHLRARPAEEKPFECPACGEAFPDGGQLARHRAAHEAERAHRCAQCGRRFRRPAHLRAHQRAHPPCGDCPKAFSCLSHLLRHRRSHTGERPFQCSFCPKRFGDSSVCRRHQDVHMRTKSRRALNSF